jgi:murein DD-endopeptidase MepM/ murein hydrolase activator NlpD
MLCGSSMHVDDEAHKYSAYAVDISMYLAAVKSAKTSTVDFAGWANGGWGNLVMASTYNLSPNIYTLHYAHLASISVSAGQNLNTGTHIGTSGNTGPSTYHLHFHIRKLSNSVNLTGMTGFYSNSNYPFVSANCGYVKR